MSLRARGDLSCRIRGTLGTGEFPHHAAMGQPLPVRLGSGRAARPTFVKSAQSLARRPDIVPPPYAVALSRLYEGAAPLEGALRRLVENELGAALGRLFADVETEPIAVASLSQVHRATLLEGTVAGHDAWVVGDEPCVQVDFTGMEVYAKKN